MAPKKKPMTELPDSEYTLPVHLPELIACVTAYNSERTLAECLSSLKPIADRIVVVEGRYDSFYKAIPDTGLRSVDRTVDIAQSFDAKVIVAPGQPQPQQRDLYLSGEPGDWYFVVDSDEVLEGIFPREAIMAGKPSAYQIEIRGPASWSPYPVPTIRIYRHIGEKPHHNPGQLLIDGEGHLMDGTHPDGFGGVLEGCWLRHIK